MSKKIFNSAVLSIIIIGALVAIYLHSSYKVRPTFSTVEAKRGNVTSSVKITGKVLPQDDAELAFETSGKITSLKFQVGDTVSAGEIIATIDDTDIKAQYAQANFATKSAEAVLEQDKQLLSREKNKLKSVKNDDTSDRFDKKAQKDQVDAQEALIKSQEDLVQAAKENAINIRTQVEKTVMKAPFDGVISKQDIEVGEMAAATSPIITLISPNDYKVEAYASELDVQKIKTGQKATIMLDDNQGGNPIEATVSDVDPASTDINGVPNYKVTLDFQSGVSDMRPGIIADVEIVLSDAKGVITLPENSVIEESGHNYVMIMENGQKEKREIKTGLESNDSVIEIVSGVKEGDEVLTFSK